jgi:Tol biopolymer transport system component
MMDGEREVRRFLESMASEVPDQARPPERFGGKARRRMVLTGALAVMTTATLVAGGVAAVQVMGVPGGGATSGPPSPATTSLSVAPTRTTLDRGLIAFVSDRSGNDDVWTVNPDGSGVRDLTSDPARDLSPAWSPNGSKIAFSSDRTGSQDIWVMDADGSDPVDLTNSPGVEIGPAWSPDGLRIAYTGSDAHYSSVWVMNADGTGGRQLVGRLYGNPHPTWSADGSEIGFSEIGYSSVLGDVGARISVVAVDGTGIRHVTDGHKDLDPSWCPEGDPVLFTREDQGAGDLGPAPSDLYSVSSDGSGLTRLTADGGSSEPSWSSTCTEIVFVRSPAAARIRSRGDIFILSQQGEAQVTSGLADDRSPAWQPTGARPPHR